MPKKTRLDAVYVIFDTVKMALWSSSANTKIGWVSSGAAKNAWNLGKNKYDEEGNRIAYTFDHQTRYVIVRVSESDIQKIMEAKNV